MVRTTKLLALLAIGALLAGCIVEDGESVDGDPAENPFLDDEAPGDDGKEDTGYASLRGVEVHLDIEADIEAPEWRFFDGPPDLAQFAVTYLRQNKNVYMEILAEDATAPDRVEWLVDGQWLTREQAEDVDRAKLRRFRLRGVNAVLLNSTADRVQVGTVFEAPVPLRPFSIMEEAGNTCATPDSHISLDQSVYWYLWNPNRRGCTATLQTMRLTVAEVLPRNPESFPEYDRLWEDGRLDVAVFFAKLDDGDVASDQNWRNVDQFSRWLIQAGFAEEENAPMGRRFTRQVGELSEVVDIYGPDIFHNVADYAHLSNWQRAVSEHEVIMYNGHSVLGTGMAFERANYPDRYQIFQVASCLSYEYYVRPVLAGKGGSWEDVDILSNVEPTYYSENLPLTSTVLSRLFYGFEHNGQASWQDIMEAVSRKLGHPRFGVSGARGNCFSPQGNRCEAPPPPDPDVVRFESTTATPIPDNTATGISSTIEVPAGTTIGSLRLEVDVTHTYVGDLIVTLSHGGSVTAVWNRQGGSNDNIQSTFDITDYVGQDAGGTWALNVQDRARIDTGTLNRWALVVTPAQ